MSFLSGVLVGFLAAMRLGAGVVELAKNRKH